MAFTFRFVIICLSALGCVLGMADNSEACIFRRGRCTNYCQSPCGPCSGPSESGPSQAVLEELRLLRAKLENIQRGNAPSLADIEALIRRTKEEAPKPSP